jgi:hypothetical protein
MPLYRISVAPPGMRPEESGGGGGGPVPPPTNPDEDDGIRDVILCVICLN